jgi:hypothetical protein
VVFEVVEMAETSFSFFISSIDDRQLNMSLGMMDDQNVP